MIRLRALEPEERSERLLLGVALTREPDIRRLPFFLERRIVLVPFLLDRAQMLGGGTLVGQLAIGRLARRLEAIVGLGTRAFDQRIRLPLRGVASLRQLLVRLLPLPRQALIRLRALRGRRSWRSRGS